MYLTNTRFVSPVRYFDSASSPDQMGQMGPTNLLSPSFEGGNIASSATHGLAQSPQNPFLGVESVRSPLNFDTDTLTDSPWKTFVSPIGPRRPPDM